MPLHGAPEDGKRRLRRRQKQEEGPSPSVRSDAGEVLSALRGCVEALRVSLAELAALKRPALLGKVEDDQAKVEKAAGFVDSARAALEASDLPACGRAVAEAHRTLAATGAQLAVALSAELAKAAVSRSHHTALQANMEKRRAAQAETVAALERSPRQGVLASATVHETVAEGLALAARVLAAQGGTATRARPAGTSEKGLSVVSPHELETFDDVGGLEEAKAQLRRAVAPLLRSADQDGPSVRHNGILLHGPPGTGKTLLARAVAGEYGLRFIRFSPAAIASVYQHEPAEKLRRVFAQAADSVPCLLFLDEVDSVASRREGVTSPDQRELVIQLLTCLEDYRSFPGLLIMAATNALDQLDPALREGRFDHRIAIPLPPPEDRRDVLEVQLERCGTDVDWEDLDLDEVAERTAGRSGAALASIVTGAAQRALDRGGPLARVDLLAEIDARSGRDRAQTLEEHVSWEDVVLPEDIREQLQEILLVFQRPELGRALGVRPPAGILLHGPPGTGKTTIAKALANEVKASFYEHSAADVLSKWVGESEQKVAQLFARARANRPSIIFIDEIDALLKRRLSDSSAPWEERVVSQFLGELDGLHSGEGVLLVGATNRPDIIDEAVRGRRLVPVEVPLPDAEGRTRLLEVLCRGIRLGSDVDLRELAAATEGLSGADLKSICNAAGMKALSRVAVAGVDPAITGQDIAAVLAGRGIAVGPSGETRTTRRRRRA